MRQLSFFAILAIATLAPVAHAAQQPKAAAPAPKPAVTNEEPEIVRSFFVVPATAREGRNPFFPHSTQGMPQPPIQFKPKPTTDTDLSWLVLNGITPNGPRRTVIISGHTFEVGEEAEIKMPSGEKMLVKCEEIKEDSAVVTSKGQRRELHLRHPL